MGSRFIAVPADALVTMLDEIGSTVATAASENWPPVYEPGGLEWSLAGNERVATLQLPGRADSRPAVRIFTTIPNGGDEVRDCGQDAVRIVVGAYVMQSEPPRCGFFPSRDFDTVKILRTAPKGRDADRLAAFLERLKGAIRTAYANARTMPRCPRCYSLLRVRKGPSGEFLGCAGFPACRFTQSLQLKGRTG